MNDIRDLSINLIATALAFVLGTSARSLLRLIKIIRGRQFWGRAISRGHTVLVLGTFRGFREYEPTALIGGGDAHALQELSALLGRLGIAFELAYSEDLQEGQSEQNLILLGAQDVNRIVERVTDRLASSFSFTGTPGALHDRITGATYVPTWETTSEGQRGDLRVDYGIVIRTRSPLNNDRTIVVLAGVYGYGTWGGVRVITKRDFLDACRKLDTFAVECVYRVEILNKRILSTEVLAVRALPHSPRPATAPDPADRQP